MDQFCKELTQLSHQNIEAEGGAKDILITVTFTNCPVSEAIKKVCLATFTQVENKGGHLVVALDDSAAQKAHATAVAANAQAIKTALQKLYGKVDTAPFDQTRTEKLALKLNEIAAQYNQSKSTGNVSTEPWGHLRKLREQTPIGQLAIQCFVNAPADALAAIPPLVVHWLDSQPTSVEGQLPVNLSDADFANLRQQSNLLQSTALAKIYDKRFQDFLLSPEDSDASRFIQTIITEPNFVFSDDFLNEIFTTYDSKGAEGLTVPIILSLKYPNNLTNPLFAPDELTDKVELPLSPNVVQALRAMDYRTPSKQVKPLWDNPKFQSILLHPEKQDITRLAYGKLLVEWAQMKGKNLVERAVSSDYSALDQLQVGSGRKVFASALAGLLAKRTDLEISTDSNWVTIRPRDPAFSDATRPDFTALGQFMRQASADKSVNLGPILALFGGLDGASSCLEYQGYYDALSRSEPGFNKYSWWSGYHVENEDKIFRILGKFTPGQLQNAENGWLAAETLTSGAGELLWNALSFGLGTVGRYESDQSARQMSVLDPTLPNIMTQLPVLAPNGLRGARIYVRIDQTLTVNYESKSDGSYSFVPSGSEKEVIDLMKKDGMNFQTAQLQTLSLVVVFPNHLSISLKAYAETNIGPTVPAFSDLPDDVKSGLVGPSN